MIYCRLARTLLDERGVALPLALLALALGGCATTSQSPYGNFVQSAALDQRLVLLAHTCRGARRQGRHRHVADDLVSGTTCKERNRVSHVAVEAVDADTADGSGRHLGESRRRFRHTLLGEKEPHARLRLARRRYLEEAIALEPDRLRERQLHAARDHLEGDERRTRMLASLRRFGDRRQDHRADLRCQ